MSVLDDQSDFSTMCRLCLSQKVELVGLYPKDEFDSTTSPSKIVEIIERFTTIKIHPWDHLPQKICECCIQTIKSMLAFQNKCRQNNEELQKRIGDRDETKNDIRILETCDTTESFEAVNVDEADSKENLQLMDVHKTEPEDFPDVQDLDESDTQEVYQLIEIEDESDTEEISRDVGIQKSGTKEILKVNAVPEWSSDEEGTTLENLIRHTRRVNVVTNTDKYPKSSRKRKVPCHICGKFIGGYEMTFHINRHKGLRPFVCNIGNCTSTFTAPHNLNIHKAECHLREAEFICDVCGKAFTRRTALKFHLTFHSDPQLPCRICDKLFKNNQTLTKHMLVHSQERKFKCETCGKSYLTKYTLRIHKRVHTQEKPYACHCGVSFAYKCLLKAHTEKYHELKKKSR